MKNSFFLASAALLLLSAAPAAQAQNIGNTSLSASAETPADTGLNEQASDWLTYSSDSSAVAVATPTHSSQNPEPDSSATTATTGTLANAEAIGYTDNARVSQSHRLVLGGTGADAVQVGIGTTDPRGLLDVAGTGDIYLVKNPNTGNGQALFAPGQVYLAPYSSTDDVAYLQARRPNHSGSLALQLRTSYQGTCVDALRLNADGSAVFGGPITGQGFTVADRHLAQGIRPLTGALASVLSLNGVRYSFYQNVADHALQGGEQIGLLAQELEKVYPALVSTDADGFKAVNYAQLTPVLIEALKEQQAQIEALQQQVTRQQEAAAASAGFEQRLRALEANGIRAEATR